MKYKKFRFDFQLIKIVTASETFGIQTNIRFQKQLTSDYFFSKL
jgi:hypothetical protein